VEEVERSWVGGIRRFCGNKMHIFHYTGGKVWRSRESVFPPDAEHESVKREASVQCMLEVLCVFQRVTSVSDALAPDVAGTLLSVR